MVTPEMVCVFEAVRAGQQRLIDAGYGAGEIEEMDDVDDSEESKLDEEVQLSPWVQAKNFRLASQGKAMVKLYGAGDPTGDVFVAVSTDECQVAVKALASSGRV